MAKIAIIRNCDGCPNRKLVFKDRCLRKDEFYCRGLGKWVNGDKYSIHEDCPLEDEKKEA